MVWGRSVSAGTPSLWSPNHAWKPEQDVRTAVCWLAGCQPRRWAFDAAIGHTGRERCAERTTKSRVFVGLAGRELLAGVGEVLPRHRYALACPCLVAASLRASCRSLPTLPMERPIVVAIWE